MAALLAVRCVAMTDHEYIKGWMTHQNGGKCCKVCGGSLGEHYKPLMVDGVEAVECDRIVFRLCACGDPACPDSIWPMSLKTDE